MLETPLWFKIVFAIWLVAFIFIEAAWDPIWEWITRKFKSFIKGLHTRHRIGKKTA
jgi:hypothetical protein